VFAATRLTPSSSDKTAAAATQQHLRNISGDAAVRPQAAVRWARLRAAAYRSLRCPCEVATTGLLPCAAAAASDCSAWLRLFSDGGGGELFFQQGVFVQLGIFLKSVLVFWHHCVTVFWPEMFHW
jgi:hypothetical protein